MALRATGHWLPVWRLMAASVAAELELPEEVLFLVHHRMTAATDMPLLPSERPSTMHWLVIERRWAMMPEWPE